MDKPTPAALKNVSAMFSALSDAGNIEKLRELQEAVSVHDALQAEVTQLKTANNIRSQALSKREAAISAREAKQQAAEAKHAQARAAHDSEVAAFESQRRAKAAQLVKQDDELSYRKLSACGKNVASQWWPTIEAGPSV